MCQVIVIQYLIQSNIVVKGEPVFENILNSPVSSPLLDKGTGPLSRDNTALHWVAQHTIDNNVCCSSCFVVLMNENKDTNIVKDKIDCRLKVPTIIFWTLN